MEPNHSHERYFWDTWTYLDPDQSRLHAFSLNAPREAYSKGQHHLVSQLAHGTGEKLEDLRFNNLDIVPAPANCSIWSGSTVRGPGGDYQIFFTERYSNDSSWAGQRIRRAMSQSLVDTPSFSVDQDFILTPEQFPEFLAAKRAHDRTVHAWRDPFVFSREGAYYMLLSAKLSDSGDDLPGTVALLRASDEGLASWALLNSALVSGYEELEVPQVFQDSTDESIWLVASTWAESDYSQSKELSTAGQEVVVRTKGTLLGFKASSFEDFLLGKLSAAQELIGPQENLYAAHIVPELNGDVVGFDVTTGERRVVSKRFPRFRRIE
jgi:hypothetical protein